MLHSSKNLNKNHSVVSDTFNQLESHVNQLELIENWTERVEKMKELRGKIVEEQEKLTQMISILLKNDSGQIDVKKKKKQDLDNLVSNFKNASTLEEKIKLYHIINSSIADIEKEIFNE
jgi:septal ring factor EnvC (AmiA/AmiB activator)